MVCLGGFGTYLGFFLYRDDRGDKARRESGVGFVGGSSERCVCLG